MKRKGLVTAVLASAMAGLVSAACAGGQEQFPPFVYATSASLQAYRAATSLPVEYTTRIPCYCGCATSKVPHQHLRDCFYNADGTYTNHAAGCDLCGRIVADVKTAVEEGKDMKTVRALIDTKYSAYGPSTDTPAPPE